MNDEKLGKFEKLALEIGSLVEKKNKAYGNSFAQTETFLKLLYPNGIPVESYTDALCIVRIYDKLKRLATANGNPDHDPENSWHDIVGYALLGLEKDQKK